MSGSVATIHECDSLKELVLSCLSETCSLFRVSITKRECEHYRQLPQHRCKRCGEIIKQIKRTETEGD